TMRNLRRVMTGAMIATVVTLGTVGVASAQTTPSTQAPAAKGAKLCDKAKDRLPTMDQRRQNTEARITKLQAAIAKAQAANSADAVTKLQARLAKVQQRHDTIVDRIAKVHARCG